MEGKTNSDKEDDIVNKESPMFNLEKLKNIYLYVIYQFYINFKN